MKRLTQLFLVTMAMGMLTGCGKVALPENEPEVESQVTNEAENKSEESAENIIEASENANVEEQKSEDVNSKSGLETNSKVTVPVEELSDKYTDCVDNIVKDCDTLDELAFTTVDVNNDGIKEFLYTESSVNASGVYVCFYDNGQVVTTGPFGCYGGIKYAPKEGKIVSVMDNMDYMKYELIDINEKYEADVELKLETEPRSNDDSYVYFINDEEVTESEYTNAFSKLKNMDVRSLDYNDMFMYDWTTADPDIIAQHIGKLIEQDEPSRECHMFIPGEEKAKLVGTWEMYSSEVEGDVSYAKDGTVSGKITVHEDYTVDLDYGRHKMSGMMMEFYNGSFNDYADNTDWYVVIDAESEDGTTIYMNVSEDDCLTVNTIGEGETLISVWDIYNRVK